MQLSANCGESAPYGQTRSGSWAASRQLSLLRPGLTAELLVGLLLRDRCAEAFGEVVAR
jgi:hypothetical protein